MEQKSDLSRLYCWTAAHTIIEAVHLSEGKVYVTMYLRRTSLKYLLLLIMLLALTLGILPTQISHAQDGNNPPPEVAARIDQAMQHLNGFLGRTDINRQSAFWSWAEVIFPDSGLDCKAPGQVVTPGQVRGYKIEIRTQEIVYDYRLSADGALLVLCINGQPSPNSVGVQVPTPQPNLNATPVVVTETITLSAAPWYAWGYDRSTDTLYLFNETGLKAELPRPRLPNETNNSESASMVTVSPDGKYLVIEAELPNQVRGLGIYSLETNTFIQVHQAAAGEEIHTGAELSFHPTNGQVAVGYSRMVATSTQTEWRVVIYDLASGNPLYQLDHTSSLLTSLGTEFQNLGFVFPQPVYFTTDADERDVIHFHMIFIGEGVESYPTIAWYPNANFVEASPYSVSGISILPETGEGVFAYLDSSFAALPANGPFTSLNGIARGLPDDFNTLRIDGSKYHFSTQWAANGAQVLFLTGDGTLQNWNVLDIDTNGIAALPANLIFARGVSNGFFSITDRGQVAFHPIANPQVAVGNPIWQAPQNIEILWVSPSGSTFGLVSLTVTTVSGPSFCPNAVASRVSVGIRARVTLPEVDPLPLRLRNAPGGEFVLSMEPGTLFTIIGGPQCVDDLTWWQIRLDNGTSGWAAEGDDERYFMEPFIAQ